MDGVPIPIPVQGDIIITGLIIGAGILVASVVIGLILRRQSRRQYGRGRLKYDLKALVFDVEKGVLRTMMFKNIAGSVYGAINEPVPVFLVQLPGTKVFIDEKGEPVVTGILYQSLLYPLDPSLEASLNVLQNTETLTGIEKMDLKAFISKILSIQKEQRTKRDDYIIIPSIGKLALTFNPSSLTRNVLAYTVRNPAATIYHFISHAQQQEKFTEFIKRFTELRRVELQRWIIIGTAVAMVILVLGLVFYIMSSATPRVPVPAPAPGNTTIIP